MNYDRTIDEATVYLFSLMFWDFVICKVIAICFDYDEACPTHLSYLTRYDVIVHKLIFAKPVCLLLFC